MSVRSTSGWTYFLKKDYGKAIKDYDEIVRLLPKETFGYGNRANVYLYGKKDYDKAIADYSEVLRLAPDKFPDGHLKRGLSYHAQKEYDKAIEDFDRAIKLSPDYAEAYHSRGLAYFAKSAYREALGDYYKAKTLILKRTNAKLIRSITSGDPTETVRRDPAKEEDYSDLARLLATCPDETVRVFLKADEKLLVDVGGHRLGANSNAPEFKIVYVFNRNNPLATLKSQVYDVRKGEYDEAAIKPFLERINAAGSQHRGFVQSVYLAKETARGSAQTGTGDSKSIGPNQGEQGRGPIGGGL